MKKVFYLEKHVGIQEESWWLLEFYLEISSKFEKSFSIARDNQRVEDDSTRAFATRQLKNSKTFNFFIFNKRHYVFRFAFALIFFSIFLFRSNRIITIVNKASSLAILTKKSFLLWSKKDYDMFKHNLFAQTHFEHFKQDDKSFMTI